MTNRQNILRNWAAEVIIEYPEFIEKLDTVFGFYANLDKVFLEDIQPAVQALYKKVLSEMEK